MNVFLQYLSRGNLTLTVLLLTILLWATTVRAGKDRAAQSNWTEFRQAIISGNTEKVATITKFPLSVRGPDDSEPVIYYNKKQFPAILKRLLHQEVFFLSGGKLSSKTMLQVVQEKERLDPADFLTEKDIRVEQFEFEKINGHWLFTRAYLEE